MEIWWDRRHETQEPTIDLEGKPYERADRWILESTNLSERHKNSVAEIFQIEANKLKNLADNSFVGASVTLKDPSGQEEALALLGSVEWLLVEIDSDESSWKMIPAENIIAAAQSTGTRIAFSVHNASDVAGLAKALELGVDALCISTKAGDDDPVLWETAFRARKERNAEGGRASLSMQSASKTEPNIEIVEGTCWRRDTKGTVLADRICVDLVQKLRPEEGCWVGSSAKVMALVLSEAASSQFVPTRPFRVNAGPVHSYILLGDGMTTKYLCELQPSDQVMVYNTKTNSSKPVAVGRLKEEVRPCVLIELEAQLEDKSSKGSRFTGQVFLQQAETVRLGQLSENCSGIRVTDMEAQSGNIGVGLKRGQVLLRCMKIGTHVGKMYHGKVEER